MSEFATHPSRFGKSEASTIRIATLHADFYIKVHNGSIFIEKKAIDGERMIEIFEIADNIVKIK